MGRESFVLAQMAFIWPWVRLSRIAISHYVARFDSGDGIVFGLFDAGINLESNEQHDGVEVQPEQDHKYGSKRAIELVVISKIVHVPSEE